MQSALKARIERMRNMAKSFRGPGCNCANAGSRWGQTVTEWQNAVTADLEARGDKMGFSVEPCALGVILFA